jgi:hypothetical protein
VVTVEVTVWPMSVNKTSDDEANAITATIVATSKGDFEFTLEKIV